MFILCPQCQFLVAIEPATGLPPAHCPRCGQGLRADDPVSAATSAQDIAAAERVAAQEDIEPIAAPVDAPVVDADAVAGASSTASAEADWAAELASPDPVPVADGAMPAPAPAVQAKREKPTKPERPGERARPEARTRHQDATKAEKPAKSEKPAKTAKPPKPEKPAKAPKPDKRTKPAKPPTTPAVEIAEVPGHVATVAPASAAPAARRSVAPSFAQARAVATTSSPRWPTAATLACLALLLAMQFLLADRARLAADARWRPAMASLCGVLHCTLPPWHQPDAFALVARDVRPTRPGVLRVSATFRNEARWTQTWPALHVALQDVDGRTVGARVFGPSEYLGPRRTQNGLAPGQVASVAFDIDEPGGTVVAFTFDFR